MNNIISPLQDNTQNLWQRFVSYSTPPTSPISYQPKSALNQAMDSFTAATRQQVGPVIRGALRNIGDWFSGGKMSNSVQAADLPTPTATPMPTPTPTQPPLPIRIAIPSSSGQGETVVPQEYANAIFKAFDPYNEATNAAQVLQHPMQVSGTPAEIAYRDAKHPNGINYWGNIGENPGFNPQAVNTNENGSLDTGLFQINQDTFNGMLASPYWKAALERRGITNYEQMKNPLQNALTAMLILMRGNFNEPQGTMNPNPSYIQWYGAPRDLRMR